MRSLLSPSRLARRWAEHPRRVIIAWSVTLVVSILVIGMLLGGVLSPQQSFVNNPESQRAADLIEQQAGGPEPTTEQVVLRTSNGTFNDPGPRAQADELAADIRALGPDVVSEVTAPTANTALISSDGKTAVIQVEMAGHGR